MKKGIGFFSILFFIMFTLKLCGLITISWWIVCLPLYLPALIVLLTLTVIGLVIKLSEKQW